MFLGPWTVLALLFGPAIPTRTLERSSLEELPFEQKSSIMSRQEATRLAYAQAADPGRAFVNIYDPPRGVTHISTHSPQI